MMQDQLYNFLNDLIILFKEKYDQSLPDKTESEENTAFQAGANFAYYDTLSIIQSQLESFGFDPDIFGQITPNMGGESSEGDVNSESNISTE